ncbi:MAG: homoserine dehydrogenase [Chlorobi bacterium]|nr:homoserine dehydrogenase [Chlorobiota bacterium]MBX7216052.1 homoserine dehydrogenase [Candidatus Kapabacteria bacterium]
MKTLNIALFGCGTVGSGLYPLLSEVAQTITWRTGATFRVAKVCVRDLQKERSVQIPPQLLTTNGTALLDDPSINVVVEVIGGEAEALGIITRALVNGKQVVTANKLVVSKHLPLLRRLEELHGGRLLYGASVCGSIPILKLIDETLPFDQVNKLRGIVNGSTNFILSRLADGVSRDEALAIAKREGFLEADPTADISGADAAQKLSILIYHAFGVHLSPDAIPTTGIECITERDLEHARAAGSTIKLVAEAARENGRIKASVAPRLVPLTDPLAEVRDEVNIVEVTCHGVGVQRFTGRGAGAIPTANAVVTDLLDIVKERRYRLPEPCPPAHVPVHSILQRVAA